VTSSFFFCADARLQRAFFFFLALAPLHRSSKSRLFFCDGDVFLSDGTLGFFGFPLAQVFAALPSFFSMRCFSHFFWFWRGVFSRLVLKLRARYTGPSRVFFQGSFGERWTIPFFLISSVKVWIRGLGPKIPVLFFFFRCGRRP